MSAMLSTGPKPGCRFVRRAAGSMLPLRALAGFVPVLPWLLAGWCLSCPAEPDSPMKVAFLAPDPQGASPHWDRTIRIMRSAAEDLQIDLQVAYSKTNTYTNRKQGLALLKGKAKPDYFVSGYWSGSTGELLAHAERLNIQSFIVGSGVVPEDKKGVGSPRDKYSRWIGQMTSDDRQGGYDLADRLIGKARQRGAGNTAHVLGLGGYGDAAVERERREGLERRVSERQDAVLDNYLFAEWSQATAYHSLEKLLTPESPVSVIWSASDNMALGAVRAARRVGKKPGEDIVIGGFNWSVKGVEAVLAGDMEVSLGGHFLQGAWALVLLYDYHRGRDFADDLGVEFLTPLEPITADNARAYLDILADADWDAIDFKQFSKVHNPGLKTYQWPLKQVLEQLR